MLAPPGASLGLLPFALNIHPNASRLAGLFEGFALVVRGIPQDQGEKARFEGF